MLVLSLGFILQLVPLVENSFYSHIFKLFEVLLTILNKREACRFGNSGPISKKLKTGTV